MQRVGFLWFGCQVQGVLSPREDKGGAISKCVSKGHHGCAGQ